MILRESINKKDVFNLITENSEGVVIKKDPVNIMNIINCNSDYKVVEVMNVSNHDTIQLILNEKGIGYPDNHKKVYLEGFTSITSTKSIVPEGFNDDEAVMWLKGYNDHKLKVLETINSDKMMSLVEEFKNSFSNPKLCSDIMINAFIKGLNSIRKELINL